MYQSLESLSKTVTSPSHSSHSDHQRFPTPLPKSRVVVVVFEMLINYSELQVFVCWSCLRSAYYANAPKFTSCFFVLPYLFQSLGKFNWSLLHANLYTNIPFGNYFPNKMQSCLATIGELTDIKRQFRSSITALDFFSKSRRSDSYWKKKIQMGSDFPPRAPTVGLILVWNDQYAPNREWSRLVCLEWWIFTQAFINIFLVATIQIYSQFFRLSWNQLLVYRQIHFIKVAWSLYQQKMSMLIPYV